MTAWVGGVIDSSTSANLAVQSPEMCAWTKYEYSQEEVINGTEVRRIGSFGLRPPSGPRTVTWLSQAGQPVYRP